jgi:lipopolysaccharide export system protein LptA
MTRHTARLVFALALLLPAPLAQAQEATPAQGSGTGVVDIEAAEMEILETDKRAIFKGDVVAKRPTDTIRCQEMIVDYLEVTQPDGSSATEVDKMDCKTAVKITTATQTITGDFATFFLRKDILNVSGNVKLVQGKTVVNGPKMTVDLKTKRTKINGGRISGRFVPK